MYLLYTQTSKIQKCASSLELEENWQLHGEVSGDLHVHLHLKAHTVNTCTQAKIHVHVHKYTNNPNNNE